MNFYVLPEGESEPKGPFDVPAIVAHIKKGWVGPGTQLAKPGESTWVSVTKVPECAIALAESSE